MRRRKATRFLLPAALLGVAVVLFVAGCGGAQPTGWSGPHVTQQAIYIGDSKGNIIAFNPDLASQKWSQELQAPPRSAFACAGPIQGSGAIYGTPLVDGDLVFATSYAGKVYGLDAATGAERWSYPQKGNLKPVVGGVAVAAGNVIFGDTDGFVYALDSLSGTERWKFPTEGKAWATPAVADGTVYVGSLDGRVYALDASSGALAWRTERVGGVIGTPAVSGDTLFVGALDRNLYAFDVSTGGEKWRASGDQWFWSSPVLAGTLVVAANTDGNVYAFDQGTGRLAWRSPVAASITATPALLDGSVAVGAENGRVYILALADGKLERDVQLGSAVQGPLAAQGDKVYARVKDLQSIYLKAIDVKTGATQSAPLEPARPAEQPTAGGSTNWMIYVLFGVILVLLFMLMRRRGQSAGPGR